MKHPTNKEQEPEFLKSEALRSMYRNRLAKALKACNHYHGKEEEYEEMMKNLIRLEQWLKNVFGLKKGEDLTEEAEDMVISKWLKKGVERRKIGDLLQLSQDRLDRYLDNSLNRQSKHKSDLLMVDVDGVILPPGNKRLVPNGKGGKIEEARFQERVKELLLALEDSGIFMDDVVLVEGKVRKDMMRKESYVIIEIPKLNREVMVCRQVGEATFVIYGILGRKTLMSKNKEELRAEYGARVNKIIYRDPEQWKHEVIDLLLKEVDINALQKIDVRKQEDLRKEILIKILTPEEWAGIKTKEKRAFKVAEMKLNAIARKFGVKGSPIDYHSIHLELGRKIYGEEHECLQYEEKTDLDKEELAQRIREEIPEPEVWAEMKARKKREFKVAGMGLVAIATKFDIKGNPIDNHNIHLELGRKIYGEEHECLQVFSPEGLTQRIREEIPEPEVWAGMKHKKKLSFKVAGMKLNAIARKFGVKGNPISNHSIHLELGRKIYGEEHECLQPKKPQQ